MNERVKEAAQRINGNAWLLAFVAVVSLFLGAFGGSRLLNSEVRLLAIQVDSVVKGFDAHVAEYRRHCESQASEERNIGERLARIEEMLGHIQDELRKRNEPTKR